MSTITRRDFINGTLVAAGSSMLPRSTNAEDVMATLEPSYYPPARTGLRGSHPGSNDHAHRRAWNQQTDWGPTSDLQETYDLIVVGGGLSGLAAGYFFRKKHGPDKKVLILDNHDDFGGHAKRNEHTIDGNTRIGYGGSQTLVEPRDASQVVLDVFADLGVDLDRFETAYDRNFFAKHDLGAITYFNKDIFGEDKVVKHPFCNYPNYLEGIQFSKLSNEEAARQAPLSARGKQQLLRVLNGGLHEIDIPREQLDEYIRTQSYFDYLKNTLGVDDPGVLRMARNSALDWGSTGTDLMTIRTAKACGALGFAHRPVFDEDHPYIHHFPDGNAGLARALVKKLIPSIGPGTTAEELVLSKFDYRELDKPENPVRIRLNSTAVDVRHSSDSAQVMVNYIHDNTSYRVKGRGVVMACYNLMIPHLVRDLPEKQAKALRLQVNSPLQYTTVGLKNWRAVKELGMGMAMSPGNMHQAVMMDFPVSLGGYQYTKSPDEPCIIQMICCPYGEVMGTRFRDQVREARYRMLSLQFEDYEREIRSHLTGMLPRGSFEFDRDVESISVNRWAHGYTTAGPRETRKIGRQPFGRITIANSDSGPGNDAKIAIREGSRAIEELG